MKYRHITSLLLAALFLLLNNVAHSSINSEAASLYEKALIAKEENETKAAIIHLKNALQISNNYIAAHVLLGNLYLIDGNPALAEKELTKANKMGADKSVTVTPLAKSYFAQHKYKQLIDDIFPLGYSPKIVTELYILHGNAQIELKALDLARDAFNEALKFTPDSISALLGLVTISLKEGNYEDAMQYSEQAYQIDSNHLEVWYAKGSINHAIGDLEEAIKDYSKVIAQKPDHLSAHIARVGIYLDLNKNDFALSDIKKIRESHPDDPRAAYLHAVLLAKTGDTISSKKALKEASTIITQLPNDTLYEHEATLMLAGVIMYSLGEYEKAHDYLQRYVGQYPHNPSARKLYGSTLLQRNDYNAALRTLEPSLKQLPNDHSLLMMLGQAYMKANQHHRASEMFDRALKIQPENPDTKFQGALNYLADGKTDIALTGLDEAFDKDKLNKQAGIILNILHLNERRFEEALNITERLAEQFPNNLTILNLLASNQIANNRINEAKSTLKQAISIDNSFIPAQINLAKLQLRQNKYDDAESRLLEILQANPNNALSMIELGKLAFIKGDKKEALNWLEKAYAKNSKSVHTAIELANLYLTYKQSDDAIRIMEEIELNNNEDLKVLDALARSYIAANKIKSAQTTLRRMSILAGYNMRILTQIAKLQLQAQDTEKAIWSLQKAVEGDSKNLPVRVLLTETLMNTGNFLLAKAHAQKLIELFPKQPQGYGLMGDFHLRNNEYRQAIENYKQAKKLQESTYVVLRLSQAYSQSGKLETATKVIKDWLKEKPNDTRSLQALAEYYLASNKPDLARKYFEIALASNSNNPDILNNLALLIANSDKEKSLAYAKKANQISPDNPLINDTLGWMLIKNGKPAEGLQYLRSAATRQASNPEIHYHIAVALELLGRKSEALKALKLSLASNTHFPEIKDAEQLMERLSN